MHARGSFIAGVALAGLSAGLIGACGGKVGSDIVTPDASADDVIDSSVLDAGSGCAPSQTRCGAVCTNPASDPNNCGMCGVQCGAKKFCSSGKCQDSCVPPAKQCGALCTDTNTDSQNCGMCGVACGVKYHCEAAKCTLTCGPGETLCNGTECANFKTDPNHCGSCDISCDSTQTCTDGLCCTTGQSNCGGTCIDTTVDPMNCGGCGATCTGGTPYCFGSKCQSCNPTVLLLADTGTYKDYAKLETALTAAGLPVTQKKPSLYAGSPDAGTFGTVVFAPDFADMNATGQSTVVTANAKGTGFVVADYYAAYYAAPSNGLNYYSTLATLFPVGYTGFSEYVLESFTQVGSGADSNAVWSGVTSPYTPSLLSYGTYGSLLAGSSVATYKDNTGTHDALVVVPSSGGSGRIGYVGGQIVYNTGWASDAGLLALAVNTIKWTTGCF